MTSGRSITPAILLVGILCSSNLVYGFPQATAVSSSQPQVDETQYTDLLGDDFEKNWSHYSSKPDVPIAQLWKIQSQSDPKLRELVCVGNPKGYLFTRQAYENFQMEFEWRYPQDPNGNSGVLVYTQDEKRLWPTSIQVQLHHPKAGSIFPSGDAKTSHNNPRIELGKCGYWRTGNKWLMDGCSTRVTQSRSYRNARYLKLHSYSP